MRSSILINIALLSAVVATARAQIVNGRFEGGVTGGCPNGWICEGNVSVFDYGATAMVRLDEPAAGAVSRLYQEFLAPAPGGSGLRIAFRYAFVSIRQPGAPPDFVPPDSFTAYLVDPATGLRHTLMPYDPPSTNPAFWTRGYFYQDAAGVQSFTHQTVRVRGPDADGLFAVIFETDLLEGEFVRIEFGLAGAANGRDTFVVIDDVTSACPPGYCCDAFGAMLPKDDGDPCTEDICMHDANDVLTGVDHPPIECCAGCAGNDGDLDIFFVIDVSGSMEDAAFEDAKEAVRTILTLYDPYVLRPRIGVGRFGTYLPQWATIDQAPTYDYDAVRTVLSSISKAGGDTSLKAGIERAVEAMPDPARRRYMVLLTDGFVNQPPGYEICNGTGGGGECSCVEARIQVSAAAQAAKDQGVEVYAKLYFSRGGQFLWMWFCPDGNHDNNASSAEFVGELGLG